MTAKEAFIFASSQLKKIDSPQLDAAILLAAIIKKPKEFLYTYPEKKLTAAQTAKYKKYIARRAAHEPIAYITGKKEFYGFEFIVSPAVLIPRPDTETLISAVVQEMSLRGGTPTKQSREIATASGLAMTSILDVGTGSGVIAVTLKKLLPQTRVFASDTSSAALGLAKKNARCLKSKITFKKGNLLSPFKSLLLDTRYPIVITANLPYLSRAEWLKTTPEVKKYEPYGALVGGKKGTEIYEKLFKEIGSSLWKREAGRDLLNPPHSSFSEGGRIILFIEIGYNQKTTIAKLAKKILKPAKIEFTKDLAGKWRVAKIVVGSK